MSDTGIENLVEHDSESTDEPPREPNTVLFVVSVFSLVAVFVVALLVASPGSSPHKWDLHPVFNSPVSGQASTSPAIQVEILDDSEGWFFTAELYLTVQSSRFPDGACVILPLNFEEFVGCRSRFIQLPFEVMVEDTLIFNLLDNDKLSGEQEQLILQGCRTCGYCVMVGTSIYCPEIAPFVNPGVRTAAEILGQAVVTEVHQHYFDNYGTATYIVPQSMPDQPYKANKLTLLKKNNYAHVELQIYLPRQKLRYQDHATTSSVTQGEITGGDAALNADLT